MHCTLHYSDLKGSRTDHIHLCIGTLSNSSSTNPWTQYYLADCMLLVSTIRQPSSPMNGSSSNGSTWWVLHRSYKQTVPPSWLGWSSTSPAARLTWCHSVGLSESSMVCGWDVQDLPWPLLPGSAPSMPSNRAGSLPVCMPCWPTRLSPPTSAFLRRSNCLLMDLLLQVCSWTLSLILLMLLVL